ncbi:MAG: vanillate O-demethylase oxidoreductase VanB [Proteobacteria bacterium]|nr:MAG: vanillate O-demethylase oxidoreductase VanB [Pseudomonadota bacterium]
MSNRIDRQIEIKANVSKVWKALTDHKQFGEWFHCRIDAPFKVGETTTGKHTWPGAEKFDFNVTVKDIRPETYFSYSWIPYAMDEKRDYSKETPTLVEFRLEPITAGTLLMVSETGFDHVPSDRRAEAFKMHTGGWEAQLKNIEAYVSK